MYSTICYEDRVADISSISNHSSFPLISYIRCSPPSRLKPKGVVVLLHGAFQTNYQFRHVIDIFAMAGYITIAPNLPGKPLAFSSADVKPDKPKHQLASDLRHLLRAIKVHGPVHLVGHDLGAEVALRFALKYPTRTASMTLGGTTFDKPFDGLQSCTQDLETIDLSSLTATLHSMVHCPASFTRNDIEEYYETLTDPTTLAAMCTYHLYSPQDSQSLEDTSNSSSGTSVPCLVLSGSEDNKTQIQSVRKAAQARFMGPLEFASIDGAKRLLAEEQPEDFAIKIIHFLHSVSRRTENLSDTELESATSDGLAAKL